MADSIYAPQNTIQGRIEFLIQDGYTGNPRDLADDVRKAATYLYGYLVKDGGGSCTAANAAFTILQIADAIDGGTVTT